MIQISILTSQLKWKRGPNDFYPLIKWGKQFKNEGVHFSFVGQKNKVLLSQPDVLIIDYRYLKEFGDRSKADRLEIIDWVKSIRKKVDKVFLFDTGDGSGSRCFWLTPYVDLHIKKQILKKRERYVSSEMVDNYMVWIPNQIIEETFQNDSSYVGCPEDQIHKLVLGWNIGFIDYRYFPLSRYYPVGTSALLNRMYKRPATTSPNSVKDILVSYRGGYHNEPHYKYQRKKVIESLEKLSKKVESVIVGGRVSKKEYLEELRRSRVIVSPYGWGEVCYRDFETFLNGSILLKPDMSHLETYPNLFKENETYVPLKWDLSDLNEVLQKISNNNHDYHHMAHQGQQEYIAATQNFEGFYNHLIKNIVQL